MGITCQSQRRMARLGVGRASTIAVAACSGVASCALAPDYEAPPLVADIAALTDFVSAGLGGRGDGLARAQDWWTRFGGDELNALVAALGRDNLELAAARARIDQARALTRQARGERLPDLSLSGDVTGNRSNASGFGGFQAPFGAGGGGAGWDEVYNLSASTSWDLDIFGGLRQTELAAALDSRAAQLSTEATDQLLTSELVTAYVGAWTLKQQIEISQALADAFAETAEVSDARYRAGASGTGALDVQIARQNQISAEADIPELKAQLASQVFAIDVLLGRTPGTTELRFETPPAPGGLIALPPGAPADLLRRRPDVAAAELSYRAALADIGAARANRYPSFSLSGSATQQVTDPADLFNPDQLFANLTAGLVAPLFQGGRIDAQIALAEASARELAADYAAAALSAVQDVEQALLFEAAYDQEIALRKQSVAAAALADDIAQIRYASGQTTLLNLLETRRSLNSAQQQLVLAEQLRLNARIDLYLALGGDWRVSNPSVDGDTA